MPKSKPTHTIVHRIELQETERAALEAALAGRFVTNAVSAAGSVLSGFGQALAPFSGALTAIAALWIADKSIEEIQEQIQKTKEIIDDKVSIQGSQKRAQSAYENLCAWMDASYQTLGHNAFLRSNPKGAKNMQDQFTYMRTTYGDFDTNVVLKNIELANDRSRNRALIPDATTPKECFVYEMPLARYEAVQVAYDARN
tara:strand:- start:366 stop:962 length:597 start_codon:yes stop_codon:yes gene_type:complete